MVKRTWYKTWYYLWRSTIHNKPKFGYDTSRCHHDGFSLCNFVSLPRYPEYVSISYTTELKRRMWIVHIVSIFNNCSKLSSYHDSISRYILALIKVQSRYDNGKVHYSVRTTFSMYLDGEETITLVLWQGARRSWMVYTHCTRMYDTGFDTINRDLCGISRLGRQRRLYIASLKSLLFFDNDTNEVTQSPTCR